MKMYPHTFSKLPAVQVESELNLFLEIVKRNEVKSYLEVGVGRGDTFHEVMLAMEEGSTGVIVDLPASKWGFEDGKKHLENVVTDLRRRGYKIHIFLGKSNELSLFNKVKNLAPFDLVFIDGDHSYKGVKTDFDNYGSLGRIIALHDIADKMQVNKRGEKIDVPLFWDQLKKQYPKDYIEFVGENSTMGIGVILKGEKSC